MDYSSNTSAPNAGRDAKNAASDAANGVKGGADVPDQTRQSGSNAAGQLQQAGEKAVDATKAYAQAAVDAAGRKVSDVKSQLETAKASATEYINEDPVRAVKMAAIGGAVLSAALVFAHTPQPVSKSPRSPRQAAARLDLAVNEMVRGDALMSELPKALSIAKRL
ncbi:hypothetical protein QTI33_08855 [Variovorax sp. J22P271]|uniref:hypothetical protein n=1 Tax=Variovorax davisae TaxID=3053515 RepID=UPI002574ADA8|nr:hypothetical protein [Variovorax sp. J22P271]MDM0032239.1 hypothetical protein [Variovorax sp. J22P271]